MTRLFGTDGIRGTYGQPPLDSTTVTRVGFELARTLVEQRAGSSPRVVIGGDTRSSTPRLATWLGAGLEAGGASVLFVGVVPTPGVAFLARTGGAACGISISASHNPQPDNGIKLIDSDGFKWSRAAEEALERRVSASSARIPSAASHAELAPEPALVSTYLESLRTSIPERGLEGLRLCLDLAHGAASPFAVDLFRAAGAEVTAVGDRPDGENINQACGSTHPERLAREVRRCDCDLGAAFDGDADRVILCDGSGQIRDGDAILYLWARHLREEGRLDPPRIVATTMSNLGLSRSLARLGVEVELCDVGDRAVVDRLRERQLLLGGEQSGHVIHLGLATTGDGLLTALQVLEIVGRRGQSLAELLVGLERWPQVLRNVPVRHKPDLSTVPGVAEVTARVERALGEEGRLLLRYSGTEPLARVMIEGQELELIERLADELATTIDEQLGGSP